MWHYLDYLLAQLIVSLTNSALGMQIIAGQFASNKTGLDKKKI